MSYGAPTFAVIFRIVFATALIGLVVTRRVWPRAIVRRGGDHVVNDLKEEGVWLLSMCFFKRTTERTAELFPTSTHSFSRQTRTLTSIF